MRGLGKDDIQIKKISSLILKSNKKSILIFFILFTSSIFFSKSIINHKIPIPQIGKAKNSFKLVEEAERLSIEEVNMATNYGFKTASLIMDRGDNKLRPQVIIDELGSKRYRYIATRRDRRQENKSRGTQRKLRRKLVQAEKG